MAEAMISPLLSCPIVGGGSNPEVRISEISPEISKRVTEKFGIKNYTNMEELVEGTDMIVVAVKPQNVDALFSQLAPVLSSQKKKPMVLSICAGVPISKFARNLNCEKIVRSMPNTPSMIQQGMTVWSKNPVGVFTDDEITLCKNFLACFGSEVMVSDEKFIDMATSISGSGPAYVFMLVESMVDTAVHMGFSREIAQKLVLQTILGSTLYAIDTKEHPTVLKNSVTSPAGTTASAMYELERGRFKTVISDAVWACYRRSLEMGEQDSNVGPGRTSLPSSEFNDFDYRR
ncbi:hypothetical protein TrVE_jg7172 [Triparma verrucosa]|uniref:Pyrroline-5-carboxylate reductase n=2 Tax=Triparma TaxID=722752 RepID=A0A9W6ZU56_9STRA|nr:hypothetical protein TrST_g7517 [Triparma strigata]GMI01699.1 hypothetical protein TrVE_jg7172 [Triparma verrucosa]